MGIYIFDYSPPPGITVEAYVRWWKQMLTQFFPITTQRPRIRGIRKASVKSGSLVLRVYFLSAPRSKSKVTWRGASRLFSPILTLRLSPPFHHFYFTDLTLSLCCLKPPRHPVVLARSKPTSRPAGPSGVWLPLPSLVLPAPSALPSLLLTFKTAELSALIHDGHWLFIAPQDPSLPRLRWGRP